MIYQETNCPENRGRVIVAVLPGPVFGTRRVRRTTRNRMPKCDLGGVERERISRESDRDDQ